jgi:hypothetical protein
MSFITSRSMSFITSRSMSQKRLAERLVMSLPNQVEESQDSENFHPTKMLKMNFL